MDSEQDVRFRLRLAEVLEPESLRLGVAETARELVAIYDTGRAEENIL